jgi:hypothetical protein
MVMRREVSRVCHHSGNHANSSSVCCHSDDLDQATATSLAQICRVAGRLYEQSPHMRVVRTSCIFFYILPYWELTAAGVFSTCSVSIEMDD